MVALIVAACVDFVIGTTTMTNITVVVSTTVLKHLYAIHSGRRGKKALKELTANPHESNESKENSGKIQGFLKNYTIFNDIPLF